MAFDILRETYAVSCPQLNQAAVENILEAALERSLEKHPDLRRFLVGMEFLATVFFCDHAKMPLDDYLEALYCTTKHSDFARPWRAALRKKPVEDTVAAQ